MARASRVGLVVLQLVLAGCGGDDMGPDGFTKAEWDKLHTLSPLPAPPASPTNRYADNPMAATLGQKFFFEPRVAGPIITGNDGTNGGLGMVGETGKVACASCHLGTWMIDTRSNDGDPMNPHAFALGCDWTNRNAGSPINAGFYYPWKENDGLRDSVWADSLTDPEYPPSQNGTRLGVAHLLYDHYKSEYNAIFQPPLDPRLDPTSPNAANFPATGKPGDAQYDAMAAADKQIVMTIFANFGKAMEAYLRLLVSRNAPFDRYVAGDFNAISPAAKRGLHLFLGKAICVQCHSGPLFSDNKFHNVGMVAKGPHALPELGRYTAAMCLLQVDEFTVNSAFSDNTMTGILDGVVLTDDMKGQWRTHGLRQVAETAPYMHTGQMATLKEVMHFYNLGGDPSGFIGVRDKFTKPLNLSDSEEDDLVEFVKTLTGDPVNPALQMDTHNP